MNKTFFKRYPQPFDRLIWVIRAEEKQIKFAIQNEWEAQNISLSEITSTRVNIVEYDDKFIPIITIKPEVDPIWIEKLKVIDTFYRIYHRLSIQLIMHIAWTKTSKSYATIRGSINVIRVMIDGVSRGLFTIDDLERFDDVDFDHPELTDALIRTLGLGSVVSPTFQNDPSQSIKTICDQKLICAYWRYSYKINKIMKIT